MSMFWMLLSNLLNVNLLLLPQLLYVQHTFVGYSKAYLFAQITARSCGLTGLFPVAAVGLMAPAQNL